MSFTVTVAKPASIHQGLKAPVRDGAGLSPLETPGESGRPIEIRIGIAFADEDLTDQGRLLDTDEIAQWLDQECARLESAPWTQIFGFRPTMELVSRDLFTRLQARIDKLAYVEVSDIEAGVVTRYAA